MQTVQLGVIVPSARVVHDEYVKAKRETSPPPAVLYEGEGGY